jgi:hypothetical protein
MIDDVLATMKAEIEECVALLRRHFPTENAQQLRCRAMDLRAERYQTGRWPTDKELAKQAEREGASPASPARRQRAGGGMTKPPDDVSPPEAA